MMIHPPIQPNNKSPVERLQALIKRVEAAIPEVQAGKKVNLASMDEESKVLYAELKKKPSAEARALLLRAVTALERLTEALEKQIGSKK